MDKKRRKEILDRLNKEKLIEFRQSLPFNENIFPKLFYYLDNELIKDFVSKIGTDIAPKFGWTDVARFAAAGIPAINFGPGDPNLAHHPDEVVKIKQIEDVYASLKSWLTA